jgi:hypothetical protein
MVAASILPMSAATPPTDGWILLHHATEIDGPVAFFDRLGLKPGGARLTIGGAGIEWAAGAEALAAAGSLANGSGHLLGIASPPDLSTGHILAFRVADRQRAAGVQPVLRLCTAVGLVAAATGAASVGWLPANLWSSASMFGEAVVATERQGLPPIMHLVAFDVGPTNITTHGLTWFCGHELRLTAPSGYPEREALRRAARLAIDAFMHDGLAGPMTVAGIDKGEQLVIGPRVDNRSAPIVPVELRPPPG